MVFGTVFRGTIMWSELYQLPVASGIAMLELIELLSGNEPDRNSIRDAVTFFRKYFEDNANGSSFQANASVAIVTTLREFQKRKDWDLEDLHRTLPEEVLRIEQLAFGQSITKNQQLRCLDFYGAIKRRSLLECQMHHNQHQRRVSSLFSGVEPRRPYQRRAMRL